jgi:hypothetical protein
MGQHERYSITPQMAEYDRLGPVWIPYLMFCNARNFESPSCRTDELGFRHTYNKSAHLVTREAFILSAERKGIVVGGSTVFGVGATQDQRTLVSRLNAHSNTLWFNFGGRAFNSTQEWIQAFMHIVALEKISEVLLVSGMNNLEIMFLAPHYSPTYGAFFSQSVFEQALAPRNGCRRPLWKMVANGVAEALRDWVAERRSHEDLEGFQFQKAKLRFNDGKNYQLMLNVFERDLALWGALTRSLNCRVTFVLQPLATWVKKQFVEEELRLFEILDNHPAQHWVPLAHLAAGMYETYRRDVHEICLRQHIPFVDSNPWFTAREWYFVDRVHLTDNGYNRFSEQLTALLGLTRGNDFSSLQEAAKV